MISPRLRRLSTRTAALLALVLAATAACGSGGSGGSSGAARRSTTVLLDWEPNPDHLALYSALDNGDYRDAGLNVTLRSPSDPSDPLKLVSTGTVDLGISYEPEVIIGATQKLDVVAVGALVPTALNSIMAIGSAGITKPADLAGKSIGTSGLSTDEAFLDAIARANHFDPASMHRIDVGADLLPAMISKKVDATLGAYRNVEGVTLTARNLAPKIIPVTEAGVPQYDELVIIARRSRLAKDPAYAALVRDFLKATAAGNDRVLADPTKAGAALDGVTDGYDPKLLPTMIKATAPLLRNPDGFGRMDTSDWTSFIAWMRQENLIKTTVATADVVTDQYLPAR
ncbi:putative hydroxymethylpyrimidine transport system substrate-binding protein [Frankia sp. AiPs1]|uniref:ABC transporter substrate-binding protein n=1 Tax=Frankia sp. AiPa1 TaxID=573492 RepID=UPI00202B45C8|nr:ABC transporter substrate-binding protein [Frankia sp. AiPa1]MCL9761476.1 ABC transporter substrate-binding protein [Frankia sp. AiPa1]